MYTDHNEVLELLKKDQEAEHDLRELIDDIIHFLHHPQGQWEPNVWAAYNGRPRYTFDQMKAAISKAWAEMAANEYTATTQPVGGGASEDVSNILDGLLRNIYNISCFDDTSTKAGKRMIASGFGCWRVVAKYLDESFYQDLMIEPIADSHRRVWFDCSSEMQTREDAMHVHVLTLISKSMAEKKWPKRDGLFESVDDQRTSSSYSYKPKDMILVGEILYKKPYKKTIYLLNDEDGSVVDEEGLEKRGVTEDMIADEREIECYKVYSRKYDGNGWLDEEKETVFNYLPIVPGYANFDVNEGKVTYEGLVAPRMDAQRVFNYSESRKVEENILAPRRKIFMDNRVAEGYEDELSNINRDPRAVQLFNGKNAEKAVVPFIELGGAAPNPTLTELSNDMIRNMQLTSGLPNELEIAQKTGRDSDFRFDQRSAMGQLGTFEYYRAHKVALEHTAKILLHAIPRVYDTDRKIRIVNEANQSSEERINFTDQATGRVINDLTRGKYDVTIKIGPTFESRKTEANSKILELGQVNPDVLIRNTDIVTANIDAPGMREVSDRERAVLFKQGLIPEKQWTDEEREQKMAEMQQPPPPDPAMVLAQAEAEKAKAETDKVQTQLLIEQAKLEQKQMEIQIAERKGMSDTSIKAIEAQMKIQAQEIENLKNVALAFKALAEAGATESLAKQSQVTDKAQEEVLND